MIETIRRASCCSQLTNYFQLYRKQVSRLLFLLAFATQTWNINSSEKFLGFIMTTKRKHWKNREWDSSVLFSCSHDAQSRYLEKLNNHTVGEFIYYSNSQKMQIFTVKIFRSSKRDSLWLSLIKSSRLRQVAIVSKRFYLMHWSIEDAY